MSYSAPTWNAVDFTGNGLSLFGATWDTVDFIEPPGVLVRAQASVNPTIAAAANQHFPAAALVVQPFVEGLANHQVATGALAVQPTVYAEGWHTWRPVGALTVVPTLVGVAKSGKTANAALTVIPALAARANALHEGALR